MDTENAPDDATAADPAPTTWCPSGQALAPEAVVLGVRSRSDGTVTYLATPTPARELLPMIPDGIEPTPGAASRLALRQRVPPPPQRRLHTDRQDPHPARRGDAVAAAAPLPPAGTLPVVAADRPGPCGRCPAISTSVHASDSLNSLIADPNVTPDQLQEWIDDSLEGPTADGPAARATG